MQDNTQPQMTTAEIVAKVSALASEGMAEGLRRRMKVPARGRAMLRMATTRSDASGLSVTCDLCHEVLLLTPERLDVADIANEVLDHMQDTHGMLGEEQ